MNKLIISAAALACAAQAFAYVEKTEQMTVVNANGTTTVFNVADVEQVTFEEVVNEYPFYIAAAGGSTVKLAAVPKVFRMSPSEAGDPYEFGLATIACDSPEEARQGEYAIQISVAPTVMGTSNVDISDATNCGVVVQLYHYADGEVDNVWEKQVAGTFTNAVDNKSKAVTLKLEAQFEDGTQVEVSFVGSVANVDDIVGLNPPFVYVNQGQYFNYDLVPQGLFDVTAMTYTANASKMGMKFDHKFAFTLSNGRTCEFYCLDKFINAGEIDVNDTAAGEFQFTYDNIQLASKGTQYANGALDGTFNIVKNDDDTYVMDFRMVNKYLTTWGTNGGSPDYVIINFTGAAK